MYTYIHAGKVVCPRYGHDKVESWWLVIGDRNSNSILSIKRVTVGKEAKVRACISVSYACIIYIMYCSCLLILVGYLYYIYTNVYAYTCI